MEPSNRKLSPLQIAYAVFSGLTILNFFVFAALTMHFGGDAVNGMIKDGHHYLYGYSAHAGKKGYTEVSAAVYAYSRWHCYSLFITWPIMLIGGLLLRRGEPRRLK